MATRQPPENWAITKSGMSPAGAICEWENSQSGETVTLPKGKIPDKATLTLLAMNGAENAGGSEIYAGEGSTFEQEPEYDDVPETALDRILVGLQATNPEGRSEVRVYKVPPDGPDKYCATFTPQEFEDRNLELIRAKFGGGKFRIWVMGTTPKIDANGQPIKNGGKFVRLANQVVDIEMPLEPLRPNDSSGMFAMAPIVEQLVRSQQEMLTRFETMNKQPSLTERLMELKALQDVFGGNNGGAKVKSLAEQIEEMNTIKAAARELSGDGGDSEPGMMGIAAKALEMIGPALANKQAAPAQQPLSAQPIPLVQIPQTLQTAQPNPVNDIQPIDEGQQDMGMFEQKAIQLMVNSLCKQAEKNGDIEPQAEFLYSKLPDEMMEALQLPQWWEMFAGLYPQVEAHQEWFTRVRDRVIAMLSEDSEGEQA